MVQKVFSPQEKGNILWRKLRNVELCNSYSLPDEEELTQGHVGSIQDSSENVWKKDITGDQDLI